MRKFKVLMFPILSLLLSVGFSLRISSDSLDDCATDSISVVENVYKVDPVFSYVGTNWSKVGRVEICEDFTDVGRLLIRNITWDDLFVRVEYGDITYSIDSCWEESELVIPLTMGNGEYNIRLGSYCGENCWVPNEEFSVQVRYIDEVSPYIGPSYFNYFDTNILDILNRIDSVNDVDECVRRTLRYYNDGLDHKESEASDYEEIIGDGFGVCADYAALVTTLLRGIGVPCKTVWGYANSEYHAWNMYYDGTEWVRIDVTWEDGGASIDTLSNDSIYVDYKYF